MGRKASDYTKTIIYKIKCNDESVLDFYVGHTTNYPKRKYNHKSELEQGNKAKLYEMIRANGGWKNWTMIEVEVYPCNSSTEAHIREEYWRETLQATMNTYKAYLTEEKAKQYYHDNAEKLKSKAKQYYQENAEKVLAYQKQYQQEHTDKLKAYLKQYHEAKKGQKFECGCGSIFRSSDKARHERSLKHQDWEKTNKKIFQQSINECKKY